MRVRHTFNSTALNHNSHKLRPKRKAGHVERRAHLSTPVQEEHLLVEGPRVERVDVDHLPQAIGHELAVEVLLPLLDELSCKEAHPALVLRLGADLCVRVDPLVPGVAVLVLQERGRR